MSSWLVGDAVSCKVTVDAGDRTHWFLHTQIIRQIVGDLFKGVEQTPKCADNERLFREGKVKSAVGAFYSTAAYGLLYSW
jgi:hypothetical protein